MRYHFKLMQQQQQLSAPWHSVFILFIKLAFRVSALALCLQICGEIQRDIEDTHACLRSRCETGERRAQRSDKDWLVSPL